MAITTPVLAGAGLMPLAMSGPYSFNNDEGDATPAVECVAAPGAGNAIYLTSITISGIVVDVAVTIQDEDATVLYGPIQMQTDGDGLFTKDWKNPLKLTDNKALEVLATNGVAFTLYGEYFIGQKPV